MAYISVIFLILFIILLLMEKKRKVDNNIYSSIQQSCKKTVEHSDGTKIVEETNDKSPFDIGDFRKDLKLYLDLKSREFPIDYSDIPSPIEQIRTLFDSRSKANISKFITEYYKIPSDRIRIDLVKEDHLEIDFHELTLYQAHDFFVNVCNYCERYEFNFVIIHGYKHGNVIKDMVNQYEGTFFRKEQSTSNPGITDFFAKTQTKDWISELKKEEQDLIKERIQQSEEKDAENEIMVMEKCKEMLANYKWTNLNLLKYFLRTVNRDNIKYVFDIYNILYNTLDSFQRDFIINLLMNNYLFQHQPTTQCLVNRELLTIILYTHIYKIFEPDILGRQMYKWKDTEEFGLNAAQKFENTSFSIDCNLLAFIIDELKTEDEFDAELTNILNRYSKITQKQRQSICDVYSIIYNNGSNNYEFETELSDDFVCLILIMGSFNQGFLRYFKLDALSPVERVYYEKILKNQKNAQSLMNLSSEQKQWYVDIRNKTKAFYQIPQNIIDKEFLEILYQDFPKIRELYAK